VKREHACGARATSANRKRHSRAKLISDKSRIIVLIIKEHVSETIRRQMIIKAISILLSIIDELGLTILLCKDDIDRVLWGKVKDTLDVRHV